MRTLTGPHGLAVAALAASLAVAIGPAAASPALDFGDAVVLPPSGLAVPDTLLLQPPPVEDRPETVLAPSCTPERPGTCSRLRDICDRLDGAMESNPDGTQTCIILLD